MEAWRVIATTIFLAAGIVLGLAVMAKVRERTQSSSPVAISGAMIFALLLVLSVLALTELSAVVVWGIVAVVVATLSVLLLAS